MVGLTKCPTCQGKGYLIERSTFTEEANEGIGRFIRKNCPTCGGVGSIR